MEFVGMALSESGGKVTLEVQPVEGRDNIDAAALRDWLVSEGYGACLVDGEALERAAQDSISAQAPFSLEVAQRSNAMVVIHIALDAMSATLEIKPAHGGTPATAQDIRHALTLAGVVTGIDNAAMAQAVASGTCDAVVVARGVLAQDGHNAEFEELIPAAPDRTPKIDEGGFIDYREHGDIVMVHSGALLMRRKPATAGVPGVTVRGDALPAKPGLDESFSAKLEGAKVSDKDPNLLQACQTGHPVRVHGGVMVEPVLRLSDVNMTTGNIRYDGTVQVDGEIGQGMRVQASGDILVGGMVDGGILEAGGDIKVAGGVIAHAKLQAKGSITARFSEAVQMYAGTAIVIGDMSLECELQSLNQIIVGASAPQRGRLIGGRATAMMLIQTPLLGSPSGGVTKLVLGANPELEARYRDLLQQIEKEQAAQESLRKLITHLTASGDPKGLLSRAQASLENASSVQASSRLALEEVEQQLALSRNATVQVGMAVAGAVDLAFGKMHVPLRREYPTGNFRVDGEGAIVFTDRSGYAVPVV
ncbi:MAG: FapA family protein [Giesbergeria sp.]